MALQSSRLLRNAHLLLYGFAGLVLVRRGADLFGVYIGLVETNRLISVSAILLIFLSNMIVGMATFLVLVGVGYALRRLLPVIEESKSLV